MKALLSILLMVFAMGCQTVYDKKTGKKYLHIITIPTQHTPEIAAALLVKEIARANGIKYKPQPEPKGKWWTHEKPRRFR